MSAASQAVLSIRAGCKTYGGIFAVDSVDFDVCQGEIHALLGENGAGKSTLAKAIAGAIQLSSGDYLLEGKVVHFRSPAEALRAGVVMVYQETSLVPTMSVAQNLQLGRERWFTRNRSINIAAQQALQSLNFSVDPLTLVEQLGTAKRQMVEIARAVQMNARVIIFDEPTASLTPEEIQHFFSLLKKLRERKVAIIFISHALEEVLQVADRITVLRDGRLVKCLPASQVQREELVHLMVGRDVPAHVPPADVSQTTARGNKVLSVENVTMGSMVKNMSFSLYEGEVVGIAGLVGSGRTEIAKVVSGVLKRNLLRGGMIYLRGRPVRYRVPTQAINDGIAYITEDRKVNGFYETMTVDDNIYLGALASKRGWRFWYSRSQCKRIADQWIERLSIVALNRRHKVIEYSGGNQQKVVIARSLAQAPDIIFFDEPTHGVDVGASPQSHETIRQLAREGKAVVVISSYLPEILSVSDRVLVARAGRIVEEFSRADATEAKIMYAAVH